MPQNPIDYLRGMFGRRQPTLGCVAPESVTAPHGTLERAKQIAEAAAAAWRPAADVDRSRPAWVRPDPVEDGPASGYAAGGDDTPPVVPDPDEPETDQGQRPPIEVQFSPLPKSAVPGHGPTFVYDEPPTAYCKLNLRDDRTDLSQQRPVPPATLADPDPLAGQSEPFVAGWMPGSRVGIPQYPDWRAGQ